MKKEIILILYYLIPFLIIRLYGFEYLRWSKKNKHRLNLKLSKKIKILHYVMLTLFAILFFIEINYYYIINFIWIKRIIIIILMISGIFFNSFSNQLFKKKIEKIYFKLFSYLPILISIIWMIPFLGLFVCYGLFCTLFNPISKTYYEDKNVKIHSAYFNPMAQPKAEIYKRKIFFNKLVQMKDDRIYDLDSVKVYYEKGLIKILFYNELNTITPIIETIHQKP